MAEERKPIIDLTANPQQRDFYIRILNESTNYVKYGAPKKTDKGYIYPNNHLSHWYYFYGGAIRGGKTYVCLYLLIKAALQFDGFRAHIIRSTLPNLEQTVLPSFAKLVDPQYVKRWSKDKSNYYCEFVNGSRIYFFPESVSTDKDLDRFKGLETNWILLEQIEELAKITYEKSIERVGSWYIDPMPPPLVLSTFNPTQGWLKQDIYDAYVKGELKSPYYYQNALPTDNPFVTDAQWENWSNMNSVNYRRFVLGDWEARESSNLFFHDFNYDRHVSQNMGFDENRPIWLSFDFNVTPMTCIAAQVYPKGLKVIREFKQDNTSITPFLSHIKAHLPPKTKYYVTGDPAGNSRNAASNQTYYQVIRTVLGLPRQAIRVMGAAPQHEASRVHCNILLTKLEIEINADCRYLIEDLNYLKVTFDGKIDKGQQSKKDATPQTIGHLGDCFRYLLHLTFPDCSKYLSH